MDVKNIPIDRPVSEVIDSLDEQVAADSRILIEMMQRISGHEPKIWNAGTIGFDSYHYKYASGREGDAQAISFYPRNNMITVYLMDGTELYADQLAKLGKHKISKVCVYIKKLADIDMSVLEKIVTQSYANIKSQDSEMQRAVENK